MGITRNNRQKRRATGGKKKHYRKARKFELGRQPTNTKIGERKVVLVRTRGGHKKFRAIRLEAGNFSWATEGVGRKTRILGVSYNATSNELVRTNTLVKNAIVQVDAAPFRLWYEQHYGMKLNKKKVEAKGKTATKKGAKAATKKGAKAGSTQPPKKRSRVAKKKEVKEPKEPKEPKEKKEVVRKPKITKEERKKNKKAKKEAAKKEAAKVAASGKKGVVVQKKKPTPANAIAAAILKRAKLSKRKRAELWRENFLRKLRLRRMFKAKEKYDKRKAEALAAGKEWRKRPTPNQKAAKALARAQLRHRDTRVNKHIDTHLLDQFLTGRLYACIASRPGQDGAADGYILEGKELEFYLKKMKK